MTLRRSLRLLGLAGCLGFAAAAVAQQPDPPPLKPITYIPLADTPGQLSPPTIAKAEVSTTPVNGMEAFAKMLNEARSSHGKLRDYTCHLVRQELVQGKLLPEQTAELRVRVEPECINLRIISPKSVAGQETSYQSRRSEWKVRFKPAGVEGVKGFVSLDLNDPKAVAASRHTVRESTLDGVLDRVESIVSTERKLNNPVQILVRDYTFAGKPVSRYEIFADRSHPNRYAHRTVLYVDKESKLPCRFEAYAAPKPGLSEGDLIEVQSYVGLRANTGLGETAFDR